MVSWQILTMCKAGGGEGQDEWICRGETAGVRDLTFILHVLDVFISL